MSARHEPGMPSPRRGPVSRVYEAIGIDDGGDPQVRRSVRRVLEQVIRFLAHYADALKREKRATSDARSDLAEPTRKPTRKG